MRNAAGQGAKRFQFAGGQSIFFRSLALGHVAKECGDTATTWISVHFEPFPARWIACFKLDRFLLVQDSLVICFKGSTAKFRKFLPNFLTE